MVCQRLVGNLAKVYMVLRNGSLILAAYSKALDALSTTYTSVSAAVAGAVAVATHLRIT